MQGEYRGDFTRDPFKQFKHFSRVLSQQGRVHLDADWNEQTAILLHLLRSLAADLIGQHGGRDDGFTVEQLKLASPDSVAGDFLILPGHYYVDGILCELESMPVSITSSSDSDSGKALIKIDRPIADGLRFDENQYVAIFDAAKPTDLKFSRIVSVDKRTGELTLSGKSEDLKFPAGRTLKMRRVTTYLTQVDFPSPMELKAVGGTDLLVYLDLWERHVTCIEDDSIREVALDGPDTASRAKVVSQIKVSVETPPPAPIDDAAWRVYVAANFQSENRGLLKVRIRPQAASTDPCITSPESRYRGAENQLYRVEIHSGSIDEKGNNITPTFKWSRENGSVVLPIAKPSGTTVTVENLGRDSRLGLKIGDYVEVVDDEYTLRGKAEPLLRVEAIDRMEGVVTLSDTRAVKVDGHPFLRRWDQQEGDPTIGGLPLGKDGTAAIPSKAPSPWLNLEDGIQIQFQIEPAAIYRTADYWLIPARTATGDIEWPKLHDSHGKIVLDAKDQPQPVALPPHGVEHHYAPLALIKVTNNGIVSVTKPLLRRTITPAAS